MLKKLFGVREHRKSFQNNESENSTQSPARSLRFNCYLGTLDITEPKLALVIPNKCNNKCKDYHEISVQNIAEHCEKKEYFYYQQIAATCLVIMLHCKLSTMLPILLPTLATCRATFPCFKLL